MFADRASDSVGFEIPISVLTSWTSKRDSTSLTIYSSFYVLSAAENAPSSLDNPSKIISTCSCSLTELPNEISESTKVLILNRYSRMDLVPFFVLRNSDLYWWIFARLWAAKWLLILLQTSWDLMHPTTRIKTISVINDSNHERRSWPACATADIHHFILWKEWLDPKKRVNWVL